MVSARVAIKLSWIQKTVECAWLVIQGEILGPSSHCIPALAGSSDLKWAHPGLQNYLPTCCGRKERARCVAFSLPSLLEAFKNRQGDMLRFKEGGWSRFPWWKGGELFWGRCKVFNKLGVDSWLTIEITRECQRNAAFLHSEPSVWRKAIAIFKGLGHFMQKLEKAL